MHTSWSSCRQVVQGLQVMAAAGQQKLEFVDHHTVEFEQNRAEHLELRRELFSVRDQLTEKMNPNAQSAHAAAVWWAVCRAMVHSVAVSL